MTDFENYKPSFDSVNDMQFNASMDALLESENFDGSAASDSFHPSGNVQTNSVIGSSGAEGARQGLTTTPAALGANTDRMVHFLPQVPYAVAANNAAPLPSDMQSFLGSPYPVLERSAHGLTQDQCPIMPAPATSATFDQTLAVQAPTTKRSAPRRGSTGSKRERDASAVSEDEGDRLKRRHDRNAREQQRSHRITEQIDNLKEVLGEANVPFKPDKFSTLVTVSDYIIQLQAKSAMLDAEHKKLIDTISKTNEVMNDRSGAVPNKSDGSGNTSEDKSQTTEDDDNLFGLNVDYRSVFARCGVPLAVLSIDGRFLDCNDEFERLTGHTRDELLPLESLETTVPDVASSDGAAGEASQIANTQSHARNLSLFNLLGRESMEGAFMAMSEMLKHPAEDQPAGTKTRDHWTGIVGLGRCVEQKVRVPESDRRKETWQSLTISSPNISCK
jgi:PAS domain-containing protein